MQQMPCRGLKARFFTSGSPFAVRLDGYKDAGIERRGWIGADELREEMISAEQLLSIAEVEGKQMSSKIFSYMSTGKPVIHIYYAKDDINVCFLERYPLALCVRSNKDKVSHNARKILLWYIWSFGQRITWSDIKQEFRGLTPEFVAGKVLSVEHDSSINLESHE